MGGPNSSKIYRYVTCHDSAVSLTSSSVEVKPKAEQQELCPTSEQL